MRIALVSPYSWTYPGGVTRHIESLAAELEAQGHDTRILAPYDPDDALSRRLHRGARPQVREQPARFVSLGRTVGLPANGAISNLSLTPHAVFTLRRELRHGGYDVAHLHEPVVPIVGWDALCSAGGLPLVGTFHTYSENAITNGIAAVPLGGRRRMNHLHVRIAVSEAAAWTARRFYGGRYRIVPNGVRVMNVIDPAYAPVHEEGFDPGRDYLRALAGPQPLLHPSERTSDPPDWAEAPSSDRDRPLRILFIGQAVERKGLPVLLRAFEALREHVPATLTLVGACREEIAHMILDDHGVRALGKVSEQRKLGELARADLLCAPSLHGESFGMVLTEAFAASTPVLASDIPGYRDVVRDGLDGLLVPPADPLALAERLRQLALDPARRARMAAAARERAERFAWPHVAAEVLDCYERARSIGSAGSRARAGRLQAFALRHGLVPADGLAPVPAQRLPSLEPANGRAHILAPGRRRLALVRRLAVLAACLAGLILALLALGHIGVERVAASLLASRPGLVAAGLGLMCAAMFVRALSWHAILVAAPTWRRAKRRDAMQGTFIGVLMSATLPARLGEPSRALIVARRLGRARETLPIVLGTMVSQTLLNVLALGILGALTLSSVSVLDGHGDRALVLITLAPLAALLAVLVAPVLVSGARSSIGRATIAQHSRHLQALLGQLFRSLMRLREGLRVFRQPRQVVIATAAQLGAWSLQLLACWFLLDAIGLSSRAGIAAAAAVLFAVNVTALVPATPANVGVFQAACVAVLAGAYHVSTPDAIAYGIVLQAIEVAAAVVMGMPALLNEGLSWREVRLRTIHAAPVSLPALSESHRASGRRERVRG